MVHGLKKVLAHTNKKIKVSFKYFRSFYSAFYHTMVPIQIQITTTIQYKFYLCV